MNRIFGRGGRRAVPFVFLGAAAALILAQNAEDWASSPEAYFLTAEERGDWKKLDSRDSRRDFIDRYWLKRDPSAGTAKNEFRETVLARIKVADGRFGIGKTPGSRTARGQVFIVLGSPARIQDQNAPKPPPDPAGGRRLFEGVTPVALVEGNETTSTWSWDPDRTPRILEVIHRASLQIKIVVEPSRHRDSIQDPGLFNDMRETVARASIVNPDLVPPPPPAADAGPAKAIQPLPHQALAAAVREALEKAPSTLRSEGGVVGSAVIFEETGPPETIVWVFARRPSLRPSLHVLLRDEEGREVATISEPGAVSNAYSMHGDGTVVFRRLPLPPGSYSAAVALADDAGKIQASAVLPLQVPSIEKDFAVSSLLITRGPGRGGADANALFHFGGTTLPPRADSVFKQSESLWYFVEVANPADLSKVTLEPRLRRGGEPLAGLAPFPAVLQPIGSKRFLAGVEMPLSTLAPGDYVLYVRVADGDSAEKASVLRRADFQIVP